MDWAVNLFLSYWPVLLIVVGVVVVLISVVNAIMDADENDLAQVTYSGIIMIGLGVIFFLYEPRRVWMWLVQGYWPVLFIVGGLMFLAIGFDEDELTFGITMMLFSYGLGALFFLYEPRRIWMWLDQFGVIHWLFEGKWYDVALKVSGAVGLLGTIIKFIVTSFISRKRY